MIKILYVDPMSYNNLAIYDKNLLSNIKQEVLFIGNVKYKGDKLGDKMRLIFTYSNFKYDIFKSLFYIFNLLQLLLIILKESPKVIHIQWFKLPSFDFIYIKLLKFIKPKIKIVHTAHNVLPHNSGDKYIVIYKKLYNKVDQIITHTEDSKFQIIDKFNVEPDSIKVIYHGLLELDVNYEIANEEIAKMKSLYKSDNQLICLNFGLISKYKGVDLLLDAWHESTILNNTNDYNLIIVGKGNTNMLNKSSNNVFIDNRYVTNEELYAYINISDIIVLPYRQISQSGVLLTALFYKKPIIVNEIGGLTDPLTIANVGWSFKSNCHESLKLLLEKVVNDETLKLVNHDNESWNTIHKRYSWESIGSDTLNIYKKLLRDTYA